MLISFLGAILPSWGYHFRGNYIEVGNAFLVFNLGLFGGIRMSARLVPQKGIRMSLTASCGLACGALLWLAWFTPPAAFGWRLAGLLALGAAAGVLQSSTFQAIAPIYRYNRAATINLAGIFFGSGCLGMALLVAGTYHVYTVSSILVLVAVIPGILAGLMAQRTYEAHPVEPPSVRELLADLQQPLIVQFAILLLLQFANEFAVAGWLPLFLTQRLGISPAVSLLFLALYFFALTVGRVLTQMLLGRVGHGKLLLLAGAGAVLGSAILTFTDDRFGVICGILFLGAGFAIVYPLVVEQIGDRFPYYDPVHYHGIFTIAFTGSLLVPALLGYLAAWQGITAVMAYPVIGSSIVFVLLVFLFIQTRFLAARTREL